tara:strand:- start:2572 stop:3234 length:663 start_codon:yes stop_codon:yes gene_type:complete
MEIIIVLAGIFLIYFLFIKKDNSTPIPNKAVKKEIDSNLPEDVLIKSLDVMSNRIVKGELGMESNLFLKKGEKLIFEIPNVSFCEERSVRIRGASQGFSIRIMKGLSYRVGTVSGGVEQQVIPVDEGNFTLTNKRIVFTGPKKSNEFLLNKINSIEPLEDGIAINRTGKSKTEYYIGTVKLSIMTNVTPEKGETFSKEEIKFEMNGFELRKIIQKLVQEN